MNGLSTDIERRLTRVEAEVDQLRSDVRDVKAALSQAATKKDVENLMAFFAQRDKEVSNRLWWLVQALIILFGVLLLAAFGIENAGKWWGVS